MRELIPNHLVNQIFKLNLDARLIEDKKVVIPMIIKSKQGNDSFKVLLDTGRNSYVRKDNMVIELKGKIDIEYLKYEGEVKLRPIPEEPGYYIMKIVCLYRINERSYRRVPYRRAIKVIEPIECDAILINISASGAMIESPEKIRTQNFKMKFTLLKKELILAADVIEQHYIEESDVYRVRCHFRPIDPKNQKIIAQAVKEITLLAKQRLNK